MWPRPFRYFHEQAWLVVSHRVHKVITRRITAQATKLYFVVASELAAKVRDLILCPSEIDSYRMLKRINKLNVWLRLSSDFDNNFLKLRNWGTKN